MDMSLNAKDLGALFDMSRDAVAAVENGAVVYANPAAQSMFGLRPGLSAAALLPEEALSDPAERFACMTRLGGRSVSSAVSRRDGLAIVFLAGEQTEASPLSDRALREFGNDLLTARLAIDAVVKGGSPEQDPRLREYTALLYRSYYRLKRLHSHLTLSAGLRQESLPMKQRLIDLEPLFRDLCDTVAQLVRPMEIELRFEAEKLEGYAAADAGMLETMLLNLLTNSLLRTPAGGVIRVSLSQLGSRFILAVDDGGTGIPPERLSGLLSGSPAAEATDPAAGAGLGLAIARGIAEAHGGTLILESRQDAGTCVRVSLPRADPKSVDTLRQPEIAYRTDGMNAVLTELSVALDKSIYTKTMFD